MSLGQNDLFILSTFEKDAGFQRGEYFWLPPRLCFKACLVSNLPKRTRIGKREFERKKVRRGCFVLFTFIELSMELKVSIGLRKKFK